MTPRAFVRGPLGEPEAIRLADWTRRSEWEVFRFALGLMRPFGRVYLFLFLVGLVLLLVQAAIPWVARYAVDVMLPARDWSLFGPLVAATFGLAGTRWVFNWINQVLTNAYGLRIEVAIRRRFFRHLRSLSWVFLQRRPVGEHIYRSISDCTGTANLVASFVPSLLNLLVSFSLILAFTLFLDPVVATAVLLFAIPYAAVLYAFTSVRREIAKAGAVQMERQNAGLQEGVAGARTVKLYGRRRYEVRRYLGLVTGSLLYNFRGAMVGLAQDALVNTVMLYAFRTGLYAYFALRVVRGELSYGVLIVLVDYTERLLAPVRDAVELLNTTRQRLVPVERVMQTMAVAPAAPARDLPPFPPVRGEVAFEDVAYRYPDGRPVLDGVSFRIPEGTTTAVVGPSGAGKSTLAGLLLRLYDPEAGRVRVDGHDVAAFDPASLQRQVGLVMQETDLFDGSLADNLRLVHPDADDDEVWAALDSVELGDWARALPQGIHTDLREGAALSIGQRQRVGIARALIRRPRLLVLDEPTASLDARTEEAILDLLDRVAGDLTRLLITHRLGTVRHADEILVLDGGRIAERGRHDDLLAAGGRYRRMVDEYLDAGAPAS